MIISLRAYNRPDYLRTSLESWARADGIADALMLFNLEPGDPEVHKIARSFDACRTEVVVNPKRYGGPRNAWMALERGFAKGDFVIHAEDDVVVSVDVLAFFEFGQRYCDDQGVFSLNAFQDRDDGCGRLHRDGVFTQPSPWGTWRDRWTDLRDQWDFDYSHRGWDWHIRNKLLAGREVVKPCLSRCQHIGRLGGTHCTPAMFKGLLAPNFTEAPHPGGFKP